MKSFLEILLWSTLQATISGFLSLILGFFVALSLCGVSRRTMKWIAPSLLVTQFVPSLFLMGIFLDLFPLSLGMGTVIFFHVLINYGFVGYALQKPMRRQIPRWQETVSVFGLSTTSYIFIILKNYRRELFTLFIFIFSICWTSVAIPLLLGGKSGATLEVLQFELLRFTGGWGKVVAIAIFQMGVIFALGWLVKGVKDRDLDGEFQSSLQPFNKIKYLGIFLALLPIFAFGTVLLRQLLTDFAWAPEKFEVLPLRDLTMGSLVLAFLTATLTLMYFVTLTFIGPQSTLYKMLRGIMLPGTILLGFIFLRMIPGLGEGLGLVRSALVLSLFYFFMLFRMGWGDEWFSLMAQKELAQVLGLSRFMVFKEVLFPQLKRRIAFFVGLAAFWAFGDFVITQITLPTRGTLSLYTQSLVESYRLKEASALTVYQLGLATTVFVFIWSMGYVGRSKS